MKVMKSFGEHIDYMDIIPENLKQFKKHGWIEAPNAPDPKPQKQYVEPVGIPVYSEMTREKLIEFAVANGMAKGKASQMKKEDLLTFLNS